MHNADTLHHDLAALGIAAGDGLFVHASLGAMGRVEGGAATVVQVLMDAVGPTGLVGMPGFSTDAHWPAGQTREGLTQSELARIGQAVPGHDPDRSRATGMGTIAETFRTWPGTLRSDHPTVSICLNGVDAARYIHPHGLAWATGPDTPLGRLRDRPGMKVLLIGVDWTRCSALHTAETLARHRRTKIRRFKTGPGDAPWKDVPDVANDLGRLFPSVGAAFEATGAVTLGRLGQAECRICALAPLVEFAASWIDAANVASGDRS